VNANQTSDSSGVLVIKGRAEADEIAAVVAVLAAASGASEGTGPVAPAPVEAGTWADRAALVGQPARPGPGGWRSSARPR
jgi:Acyl-CoA carboxylase epsilon subunit